jgi:hypothetical protein
MIGKSTMGIFVPTAPHGFRAKSMAESHFPKAVSRLNL